jgi:hypothetical protein
MSNADVRRRFHIILVAGKQLTHRGDMRASASLAAEIGHAATDADRYLSDETAVEAGAQPPGRRGNERAAAN